MFERIRIRGTRGAVLWGYRTAAEIGGWTITKDQRVKAGKKGSTDWTLTAQLARVDAFQLRQRPLLFTAPRPHGFWAWPLLDVQVGHHQLVARLGPPEQ